MGPDNDRPGRRDDRRDGGGDRLDGDDGRRDERGGRRAPDPHQIYARAVEEGNRRLNQGPIELVATSFIAGFTIVFGIVAQGMVHAALAPDFAGLAGVGGPLAFGVGLIFLIVGRAELFSDSFFDPVVAAIDRPGPWYRTGLLRLWIMTLIVNLVGGVLIVAVLSIEGALPPGTAEAMVEEATGIVERRGLGGFASAIAGGTLVTTMSYLLVAVDSDGGRIVVSYVVGVLLALGGFDHVVVTVLHVVFGMFAGAPIGLDALTAKAVVTTAGNLVGGLGLGTLTHVVQVKGARRSES